VATCSSPLVYGVLSTQIWQACSDALADLKSIINKTVRPSGSPTTGAAATVGQPSNQCVRMRVLADVEVNDSPTCTRLALVAPSNYTHL